MLSIRSKSAQVTFALASTIMAESKVQESNGGLAIIRTTGSPLAC